MMEISKQNTLYLMGKLNKINEIFKKSEISAIEERKLIILFGITMEEILGNDWWNRAKRSVTSFSSLGKC